MRPSLHVAAGVVAILATATSPAGADEVDDLATKLDLPAQFHEYKPNFHYRQQVIPFDSPRGAAEPDRQMMRLVMDGKRYVALIADDHIQMLAFTPLSARENLRLRTGRYHLDNTRGPIMPTGMFLPEPRRFRTRGTTGIPRTDHFRGGGSSLELIRAYDARHKGVLNRFVFKVDERLGYVVEATIQVTFKEALDDPNDRCAKTTVFCPNSYVPWPTRWLYDYTVLCPGGGKALASYPNNTLTIDRVDATPGAVTWRDGGFVAFLHAKGASAPCHTRSDGQGDGQITVDNLRNRLHVTIPFKDELDRDKAGREVYTLQRRLLGLPPVMAKYLREHRKPLPVTGRGVVLRIGKTEDFEGQPVFLSEPIRGLAWTDKPPTIATKAAHSGTRSLVLTGAYRVNDPKIVMAPDIPYVPLRPNATYLLEAWLKVDNMTSKERDDYLAAYKQMARRLKDAEQEVPEYVPTKRHAEAYLTAHLFETTPEQGRWVRRQQTTVVRGTTGEWQKAELTFTTPGWDPYVQIGFVCDSGSALIDDLALKRIR